MLCHGRQHYWTTLAVHGREYRGVIRLAWQM
jgi:hypothetical protein